MRSGPHTHKYTSDIEDAFQDLANAIVKTAVSDYEMLISDAPASSYLPNWATTTEIRIFAKEQHLTSLDVNVILNKIDKIYEDKFRPYVLEHGKEITKDWKKVPKKGSGWNRDEALKKYPHKCPLCGGSLRPLPRMKGFIGCTSCDLNAKIKKEEK